MRKALLLLPLAALALLPAAEEAAALEVATTAALSPVAANAAALKDR